MKIFVNSQLVDPSDARIDVQDAGFQHAVGLFETMGAWQGRVFRLAEHLARMQASARALGLADELDLPRIETAIADTVRANELDRARIRVTYTPGPISLLGPEPDLRPEPTLVVVATESTEYDPTYFERGITVAIGPASANPMDAMAGHKTLAYWGRLRALRQAAQSGAGEAIHLNITNHLAGGAVSNLMLVKGDTLHTPIARGEEVEGALPAPVLPGITRATVIELAHAMGIDVKRAMLSIDDLLDADEVFLTNSSWLVLPVMHVEQETIGDGKVGAVTRRLREQLMKTIVCETGGA